MRVIEFIKRTPPYNPGEVAGFNDVLAAKYVNMRSAVYKDEVELEDGSVVRATGPVSLMPNATLPDGTPMPVGTSLQVDEDGNEITVTDMSVVNSFNARTRLHGTNDQEYADDNGTPSDPFDPTPTLATSVDSVAKYDRRVPNADEPHTEVAHVSATKLQRQQIEANTRELRGKTPDGEGRVRLNTEPVDEQAVAATRKASGRAVSVETPTNPNDTSERNTTRDSSTGKTVSENKDADKVIEESSRKS